MLDSSTDCAQRPSIRPCAPAPYEPPAYRVVSLDCEITAYAPDDEPLF